MPKTKSRKKYNRKSKSADTVTRTFRVNIGVKNCFDSLPKEARIVLYKQICLIVENIIYENQEDIEGLANSIQSQGQEAVPYGLKSPNTGTVCFRISKKADSIRMGLSQKEKDILYYYLCQEIERTILNTDGLSAIQQGINTWIWNKPR